MVTHGINVRSLAALAYDKAKNTGLTAPTVMNQHDIPYCGISAANIKGKTWSIVFGGSANHLVGKAAEKLLEVEKAKRKACASITRDRANLSPKMLKIKENVEQRSS